MTINDVSYSCNIEEMIIANLDGWTIEERLQQNQNDDPTEENNNINPFMTSDELQLKHNKVITRAECRIFYEETLDMAYMHTNRLNIEDLTEVEARTFKRAVCKWTASNLWNKYNIRVNNEDLEDTYVQSYGGLLYKSAIKSLQPFINQRISNLTKTINKDDDSDDVWVI